MGMDIRQANCPSRHLGVLGGQQLQNIRKLSDWHQLWWFIITSADSCGNGRRLNTSRSSISQGALGVWGHKFKSLGKLSNGCTGWHRIWYTSADSSGNGYRLNTIRPTIPQGHFGGGGGFGSQIQMFGEAVKRLGRLAPNLVQICTILGMDIG